MSIYVQGVSKEYVVNLASNTGSIFNGVTGNFDVNLVAQLDNEFASVHFPEFIHLSGGVSKPIIFELPGDLQPELEENIIFIISDNGVLAHGLMNIKTSGLATLTIFPLTSFTSAVPVGFIAQRISYIRKRIPS